MANSIFRAARIASVKDRVRYYVRTYGYTTEEIVEGRTSVTLDAIAGELGISLSDPEHRALVKSLEG